MQYLEPSDLAGAYYEAQQTQRRFMTDYDEIERLASNEVRKDLPANMPKVNDGTLSASIKKIPRRTMANPMTGLIKPQDRDEDWIGTLASIIWEKRIIPNANTDASYHRKWKLAVQNSKVYGGQPIYTFFTQHGTYIGADMSLPYVRTVYLEPGKTSDLASDYIFMDSYFTKLQMKRLLDKAAQEMKQADAEGWEYEGIWDAKALQTIYDAGPGGDKDSQSQNRRERDGTNRNNQGLFKLTTCFNRGYDAPFLTFAPAHSGLLAGTQNNTNPSGDVPIIYVYHEQDLVNPYGTGLIKTAGPMQNVMDNLIQTDVLSTQTGSQPPINIKGDIRQVRLSSLVYGPSAKWITGNATVEPVLHANPQFYGQLPTRMGMYQSKLQYQTGTFDNTVSGESGNPSFSKTDSGVNELAKVTDADDSDTLHSVADAVRRVVKSMVNIHMNNMEGTELLKLEGDEIDRMLKTGLAVDEEGNQLTDMQQVELVWDNLRGDFDFEVEPDSSLLKSDKDDVKTLSETVANYMASPIAAQALAASGYKFDLGEALAQIYQKSGIKDTDKIIKKLTPEEMAEQEAAAQMAASGVVEGEEVPVDQAGQPSETETRLNDIMEQYAVDQEDAASIAAAQDNGQPITEELLATLREDN